MSVGDHFAWLSSNLPPSSSDRSITFAKQGRIRAISPSSSRASWLAWWLAVVSRSSSIYLNQRVRNILLPPAAVVARRMKLRGLGPNWVDVEGVSFQGDFEVKCTSAHCDWPGFACRYCGTECQSEDWQRHKKVCDAMLDAHRYWYPVNDLLDMQVRQERQVGALGFVTYETHMCTPSADPSISNSFVLPFS